MPPRARSRRPSRADRRARSPRGSPRGASPYRLLRGAPYSESDDREGSRTRTGERRSANRPCAERSEGTPALPAGRGGRSSRCLPEAASARRGARRRDEPIRATFLPDPHRMSGRQPGGGGRVCAGRLGGSRAVRGQPARDALCEWRRRCPSGASGGRSRRNRKGARSERAGQGAFNAGALPGAARFPRALMR